MDVNQYFKVGINSIQPSDLREVKPPKEERFIPLGRSVIGHIKKLDENNQSNSQQITQLIKADEDNSEDPSDFYASTYSTMKAINHWIKTENNTTDINTIKELEAAASVITALYNDQNMLKEYMAALTLV
jgi:hypothetical protein